MPRHSTKRPVTFLHPIFSPKGEIEGAMVRIDSELAQLVFKPSPHLEEAFATRVEGDEFEARTEPLPAGGKGTPEHPVHELVELAGLTGSAEAATFAVTAGKVVRFNHARHGEANGVVLDNGDFIHLRPDGHRQAGLTVGDHVEAEGEMRPLRSGPGRVVEAVRVNGIDIAKPIPRPKPHEAKHAGHKPTKPHREPSH